MRFYSGATNELASFKKAFLNTRREMFISLLVLVVTTLFLSVIFYICENVVQPEVFSNYGDVIAWAFSRYVDGGDGVFEGGPATYTGRSIAFLLGLIGIAIVAIPAGLIGSGFIEAIEEEKKAKTNAENAKRIYQSMYTHCSLLHGVRYWPKKLYRLSEIRINLGLNDEEIYSAVRSINYLRLRDLGMFVSDTHGVRPEMMAVEMCRMNRSYGFCSAKPYEDFPIVNSNITIVCPTAKTEAGLSYFAYQIARIGGFNVVINETLSSNADNPEDRCVVSGIRDTQYADNVNYPKIHEYIDDIKRFVTDSNKWVVVLKSASSPTVDKIKQKIRLDVNVNDESEGNTLKDATNVNDVAVLQSFYDDFKEKMSAAHDIDVYVQYNKNKPSALQNYIRNKFDDVKPNVIQLSLADDYRVFGSDVKAQWITIKTMAEVLHNHFDKDNAAHNLSEWTTKEVKASRSRCIPIHIDEQE